jgi:prolyl-tRNA editing enzyme YbaK/EbsC (Cys-tRNA(Pro) deacylase)
MSQLSPSAQKYQDYLKGLDVDLKVVEFEESARTAQEAADRIGCRLGQIVKSLLFQGTNSHKAVLVLTSGANRVDVIKMNQVLGEPITRPDADFVRELTGFSIGSVPPFGHLQPIETFIDEDLLHYPTVWASGGAPNAVFMILPADLVNLSQGKVTQVK